MGGWSVFEGRLNSRLIYNLSGLNQGELPGSSPLRSDGSWVVRWEAGPVAKWPKTLK